jgi:hypothetical protein
MSLYYSLAREISGEKLVQDIANMVTKFLKSGGDKNNSILTIQIHTISDHTGDSLMPKLECKNINDCPT